MSIKIAIVDVETTGMNPGEHTIWSLSASLHAGREKEELVNLHCRPIDGSVVDKEALEVGGVTEEQILAYPDPKVVRSQFEAALKRFVRNYNKTDKLYFVGYNGRFDYDHVRAWWSHFEPKYFGSFFWHPPIDVMNLAATWFMGKRQHLPNFRLGTVARELGIEVDEDKLHGSDYDISLTVQMFRTLYHRMHARKEGKSEG